MSYHNACALTDAGKLSSAIKLYIDLLAALQPGACSGLYADILLKRAAAQSEKQDYGAALQDLDCGLQW